MYIKEIGIGLLILDNKPPHSLTELYYMTHPNCLTVSNNNPLSNYPLLIIMYEDEILLELMNTPGEIFDIPELQQDDKFDVESYINGETDYAW